jgi:HTH-type transcriptional regulator / antitoxin HipB
VPPIRDIFPIRNMKTIINTTQLGGLIRAERKRLKVTQKDLAMAAGTGLRFIVELESGKETSRIGKVLDVLRALGMAVQVGPTEGRPRGADQR